MRGWIKDYRRELESDIWSMPPLYHRVWQWLKYRVNHQDKLVPMRDGSKLLVRKGQHLTSYRRIAEGVKWYEWGVERVPNPKTIKSIIDWLISENMVEVSHQESNSKGTLITLCNYSVFQGDDEAESNAAETVEKQSLDTNKNDKNDKNEKNTISSHVGQPEKQPSETILYQEIIDYLNLNAGTSYTHTSQATRKEIRARWNEGHRLEHFKRVIDNKIASWMGTKWQAYLRPSTLFRASKFEGYLNEKPLAQAENEPKSWGGLRKWAEKAGVDSE